MCDIFTPTEQHKKLSRLAYYLRPREIKQDAYGAPLLKGKRGHIYATPDGYQVYVRAPSGHNWSWLKRKLSFAKVTQDGDDEGCLVFKNHRLNHAQGTLLADAIEL